MSPNLILVGTDFSEPSRDAASAAAALARGLGARLVVATTFDAPIVPLPDASILVDAQTLAQLSNEAQAALDAEVARVKALGVEAEGTLRQGDARTILPQLATELGAGLLVVGSHGRRGLARALLGSVAERVVRESVVPVLVVPYRKGGAA